MQMLELGKTIAAKAWLMPGLVDYMASFHIQLCHQESTPVPPPSSTCSWDGTNISAAAWPAFSQLKNNRQDQACLNSFCLWQPWFRSSPSQKKHSSHSYAAIVWPDCRNQAPNSLISLAKCVPTTSCASICNLLWLHESLFFQQTREFPGKKSYSLNAGKVGSQLVLCQIQRCELLKTPKNTLQEHSN